MVRITKAEYDRIGDDYKSTYQDYQGNHPNGLDAVVHFFPDTVLSYSLRVSALKLFNLPPGSRTCGRAFSK